MWRLYLLLCSVFITHMNCVLTEPYYDVIAYSKDRLARESASSFQIMKPKPSRPTRNYRLPNNCLPIHYEIEWKTTATEFFGHVAINIHILEKTDRIVLHGRDLNILGATIQMLDQNTTYEMRNSNEPVQEFLTLRPENKAVSFNAEEIWNLQIQFSGNFSTNRTGIYTSKYKDTKLDRIITATKFESTNARSAFPCFDEPAKRATFGITINHDESYYALSNMPVDTAESSPGRTVFQKTPNMSTYLVGFIICNFNITKIGLYSLSIGIGSQPGTEGSRNWALITSMRLLDRHNQYFMVNYMLPKIDQLAIPGLVESAVDNWGLCTYSEDFLLFNEKMDSVFTKTSIAITISHQLANQWFGSYVTLDWWSYLWLKTGLATLYGYDAIDEVFNDWDIYQYFHVHAYQAALLQDGSNLLPSMSQNVERPEEIERMFDIISYGKSGAVLSMWRHALTDTVFRQGIQIYLEEYQLKAATESNFCEAIQKAIILEKYTIPKDFPSMMFSWTTTPSYPLLTVKRNYDDNSFMVYQKAFSNNGSSNDYLKWFIPLNFATKSNFDFRSARATHFMLDKMKSYVPDVKVNKHEWLLLNKQSTGYYRINYDQRNWYLLAAGLKEETYKFHPRNRAQLIDDSYQLSISHELNNKIFLEILSYLPNESEYAPWETARAILTKMNLVMLGNKQYKVFRNFVAGLVLKVFKELGFYEIPGEKHFQKFTRACVIELACMIDLDGCLKQSSRMVYSYLEGDIENIDPNLQKVIYCNGLKTATDYLFDAYVRILMTTNDQNERKNLIGSLGCSQNVEHWNQLLGSTIIDKAGILTEDECSALLAPIYSLSDAGLRTTITFIAKSIQSFSKPCRDAMLKIIPDIANYIVNKEQSNLFAILITEVFRTKAVPFDLIQDSLKTTEENIRRSMNVESIVENMEEDKPVDEKDSKTIMHVPSISLLFTMFVISH